MSNGKCSSFSIFFQLILQSTNVTPYLCHTWIILKILSETSPSFSAFHKLLMICFLLHLLDILTYSVVLLAVWFWNSSCFCHIGFRHIFFCQTHAIFTHSYNCWSKFFRRYFYCLCIFNLWKVNKEGRIDESSIPLKVPFFLVL